MTGRTNGVATYRNNNFFGLVDGLNFALQYQGKNQNDGRNVKKQNGDGWGISSTYDIGEGVSFGAAYFFQPYRRSETAFQRAWRQG